MKLARKLRGEGASIAIRASKLALFLIVGSMNLLDGIWNYASILCWAIADNSIVSSMTFQNLLNSVKPYPKVVDKNKKRVAITYRQPNP